MTQDVRPDVAGLLRDIDEYDAHAAPRGIAGALLTRCRSMIETLTGERGQLGKELSAVSKVVGRSDTSSRPVYMDVQDKLTEYRADAERLPFVPTEAMVTAFIKGFHRVASLMHDNPYYAPECAAAIWQSMYNAARGASTKEVDRGNN